MCHLFLKRTEENYFVIGKIFGPIIHLLFLSHFRSGLKSKLTFRTLQGRDVSLEFPFNDHRVSRFFEYNKM